MVAQTRQAAEKAQACVVAATNSAKTPETPIPSPIPPHAASDTTAPRSTLKAGFASFAGQRSAFESVQLASSSRTGFATPDSTSAFANGKNTFGRAMLGVTGTGGAHPGGAPSIFGSQAPSAIKNTLATSLQNNGACNGTTVRQTAPPSSGAGNTPAPANPWKNIPTTKRSPGTQSTPNFANAPAQSRKRAFGEVDSHDQHSQLLLITNRRIHNGQLEYQTTRASWEPADSLLKTNAKLVAGFETFRRTQAENLKKSKTVDSDDSD
ncbi:hypothetical protein LTR37_014089 [Vermiconidia calcicola]|uniref:Uncharacterized protein n=1 Tax=Vermiconidia calcicola TaxID=1690605 RepID=A0ACC3MVB2_9PEZI|nr:hypothetical protein LTR37_014089 [Vermiconidia calcicola]